MTFLQKRRKRRKRRKNTTNHKPKLSFSSNDALKKWEEER